MNTVFVNVYRVQHDDYMFIPEEVQKQYPDKFILQEEVKEETVVAVEEVKTKKRNSK